MPWLPDWLTGYDSANAAKSAAMNLLKAILGFDGLNYVLNETIESWP